MHRNIGSRRGNKGKMKCEHVWEEEGKMIQDEETQHHYKCKNCEHKLTTVYRNDILISKSFYLKNQILYRKEVLVAKGEYKTVLNLL